MLQSLNPLQTLVLNVLLAIYFIFPAYVANATPVIGGGGALIDGGKILSDGEPLFGPGKTIRGLIVGIFMGTLTATIQALVHPYLLDFISTLTILTPSELDLLQTSSLLGLMMSTGALTGDLLGSFIKRRLKLPRGRPAPPLDQLDFLAGALCITYLVHPLHPFHLLILLVLTPLIHFIANIFGYILKFKKEPW